MVVILNFSDHNLKRAVDACLAGSQKLSKSKITDLEKAKKYCEEAIEKFYDTIQIMIKISINFKYIPNFFWHMPAHVPIDT